MTMLDIFKSIILNNMNTRIQHTQAWPSIIISDCCFFPREPGLAGCPLNSPSPFIPGLRILLGQT